MKSTLRMTPQTLLVLKIARKLGHATNAKIVEESRKTLPYISSTTVHRITKRLILNGLLADGPKLNGQILVDANTLAHDHFLCNDCNGIKDLTINNSIRDQIKNELQVERLPSSLTIYGDCKSCLS